MMGTMKKRMNSMTSAFKKKPAKSAGGFAPIQVNCTWGYGAGFWGLGFRGLGLMNDGLEIRA